MESPRIFGYAGRILRVDLSTGRTYAEAPDEATLRMYVGGATLGIKYLYDEVPPDVVWCDPENRVFLVSGPLGGTRVGGSGAIAVVTKGALTNGVASSQANGFFGTFLRSSGFDAVVLQGAAPEWVYLYIHDGVAEIRKASHLLGKNTVETNSIIRQDLQKKERQISTLSIGPAGEHLVRFACAVVDEGHVAGHNGIGAVIGSKKLKAVVVERGRNAVPLKDKEALTQVAKELLDNTMSQLSTSMPHREGTVGGVVMGTMSGMVPVRNYTTGVHAINPDKLATYEAAHIRSRFKAKPAPCWACSAKHCHRMVIAEGSYAGRIVEEPEYEGMAAFSALVGIDDVVSTVVLASEVDRLGLDTNEAGWVIAWVMECFEKGILTIEDTDGLDMTWGNGEAIMEMLNRIAFRQGFGNILAEGVMRAARHVGGQAPDLAIYTLKGNTPRGHDHRAVWFELFDTCVSNTGTIESHQSAPLRLLGLPESYDKFDPEAISTLVAKTKGAMVFEDSVITCRFNTSTAVDLLCRAVNAATGWSMGVQDAMNVGRRAVNLARAFNLRNGIGPELDAPSPRYGSTPSDGVAAGRGIMQHWAEMLRNYYNLMGWDEQTSRPLPETLSKLGLDFVIPQLWKS